MKIVQFVKDNYDTLPESRFNGEGLVVVMENANDDQGYGHHTYDGIGVDRDGKIFWCFSSGCSCDGTCGLSHELDVKKFEVEGYDLASLDPESLDFTTLQVEFSDY